MAGTKPGHDGKDVEATVASWFETAQRRLLTMRKSYFAGLGSIGVVPRTPRISSSTFAPASN